MVLDFSNFSVTDLCQIGRFRITLLIIKYHKSRLYATRLLLAVHTDNNLEE